jgi:hypothetical protein
VRLFLLVFLVAGCGEFGAEDPAPAALLESDYRLPWSCGARYGVTQGNQGDLCTRSSGDHVAVQAFAWDFSLPAGTAVVASRGGTVTLAAQHSRPGDACFEGCPSGSAADCCARCLLSANRVNVDHGDGTVGAYWHARVRAGDVLGFAGSSGCSTGPHLHFQVMGACLTDFCQSQPIGFAEASRPACGDRLISRNCP